MKDKVFATIDGNEAAAYVAYRVNEVCSIYPITPSSNMAEWADEWASKGIKNLWGEIPTIYEMQSEGGAAGAVHGSLQAGALTTTFTASQGLLLKIPNMFKIAGELTSTVFHISARSLATHALSIFGDHSDVMSARMTGFAFLAASSVQEVMDFGLIAQATTLRARVPILHFFDGFRTSHEVSKIEVIPDDDMREMISEELITQHRQRALSPDHPTIRGTAQNPDVFFQAREACNPYYNAIPGIMQEEMDKFAKLTGRQYKLYEYEGAPDAEKVIMIMASAAETVHDTVDYMTSQGEKVGVLKVRMYRPFDNKLLMEALPTTVKQIAVLDRTKEPGSADPMYLDVVNAFAEGMRAGYGDFTAMPLILGGRYGLSSKEFTPAMVKGVFDHVGKADAHNHFTVGIKDDVTNLSIDYDPNFSTEGDNVVRALFYGLGSDGTVGANKNSIKIIGENTDNYAQGYFVYDSKKAGSITTSHLRFGPDKIRSPYLITKANFVACHQTVFLEKQDMVKNLDNGGTFLINSPWAPEDVWAHLPKTTQQLLIDKKAKLYTIDAQKVAAQSGMGRRINTVMQTAFFAISGVLPREEAIEAIKQSIRKTYGKKGDKIVNMNITAVENSLENLHEVPVPAKVDSLFDLAPPVPADSPEFVKSVLGEIIANRGDDLPVSVMPADGTFPVGTTKFEKRNIALEIPVWDPNTCIQCGKCSLVCPHGTIRIKVYDPKHLAGAPETFKAVEPKKIKDFKNEDLKYTIQVAPEDCTGCGVCVEVCPAKNKSNTSLKAINMAPHAELRAPEAENWDFFLNIPEVDRKRLDPIQVKLQQMQQPLFEFSGACAGCGETPYVKLISQMFGDRTLIANATGCSSIYGGNLPTTPYTTNKDGRGPTWSNSLFEDNAEFGFGYRLAIDQQKLQAENLVRKLADTIGQDLADAIVNAQQREEEQIFEQRERIEAMKEKIKDLNTNDSRRLMDLSDYLAKKSVWLVGGDGWAYDIGFGGLDHVLASGKDINVLVMDTEVYSNTGGQMSKATPLSSIAKFAASGKPTGKKDLGMMAMSYGNVYVGVVAMGANDAQTLKTFVEAEKYPGPSIIIAYSHCIAHGINMSAPLKHQKAAVDSGQWVLYRYNPERTAQGLNPMTLDSKPKNISVADYMNMENRFRMLTKSKPETAKKYYEQAQVIADDRFKALSYLADRSFTDNGEEEA